MQSGNRRIWTLVCSLLSASLAAPASGDVVDDLQATVREQGRVIRELRGQLDQMRQDQRRRDDRIRVLEDSPPVRPAASGLSREEVDRRIEAFQTSDTSRLFLSGYGTAQFVKGENSQSTFLSNFNPIFHFRLTERLHFNAELEVALTKVADSASSGSLFSPETDVGLEFAQLDFLAKDWLTLSAGQFILPFNSFGPRLH
ncbi:MAG: hypothetical protein ACE5IL_12755, partial [Myxococcota bacterium]